MPKHRGIQTGDIQRIQRFSQFVSQLIEDFDWIVCRQYLSRRDKLIAMLAEYWDQTERSTREDVRTHIEKDCAQKLSLYARKTLQQDEKGKLEPVRLNRKTLAETIEIAGLEIASLFEAIRALRQYQDYYQIKEQELLYQSREIPLARKKELLSRLDNLTGDLSEVIPQLTKTATDTLIKMKRFTQEFSDTFEQEASLLFALQNNSVGVEFCLSSTLFSGEGPCRNNLPIYLDGSNAIFKKIDFDDIDIYSIGLSPKQNIRFENCKGTVSLSRVKKGGLLVFCDCPSLFAEITHCDFDRVELKQYVDRIKLESIRAKTLSVTANTSILALEDCQIHCIQASTAAIDHISLTHSKSRLHIKDGADINYLGIDPSSTATVLASNSRVGRLKPGTYAQVIADNAVIDELDLRATEMAFVDQTRSRINHTQRNESGIYQEIFAPDGSRYTILSKRGLQDKPVEKLDLSDYRSTGQAAYLTGLIAGDKRSAGFYDLSESKQATGRSKTLLKSAALSLTRSGITPTDTAWNIIASTEHQTFGEGESALSKLTQDIACAEFIVWRADHFPEEHTAIVADLPLKKRIAALHYIKEMADRKRESDTEMRQEMARFNMEIAGIAVLAKAWRLIIEYEPGEMSMWAKHKAKNELLSKLQQLIVDDSLTAEEIAKRALIIFQESKKLFSIAWKNGKTMATFFGLSEQMIKKYQRSCMLARQIDATIELELKGKKSRIYRNVLERHHKRKETMILTEAVAKTIDEMEMRVSRSHDADQVAALNSICARQTSVHFKRELTEVKRLENMLEQVFQLATTYSPVIAICGPGKQKLKVMRQLATLASNSSKNVVHRKRELALSLKILQQHDDTYQRESGNPFAAGFTLWQKRSRANRGYKMVLVRINNLLSDYATPEFWPKKQGAGDIDHFAIPDMDQAMLARQDRLFKQRRDLGSKLEKRQKYNDSIPTFICTRG